MNKFDKIKYIMDLEEQKSKLQRQISKISNEISEQKKSCSHISVDLGYYGLYPSTGDEYCFLLCGMGKIVNIIMNQNIWFMLKII